MLRQMTGRYGDMLPSDTKRKKYKIHPGRLAAMGGMGIGNALPFLRHETRNIIVRERAPK